MNKEWYVLQALTGQESKARDSILKRLQSEEMTEFIDEVLIPVEKVTEVKKGVKRTINRKFFPGYLLAHIALYDDSKKIVEKVWYFIRETPGVIGFIGGNEHPVPLRQDEVDVILHQAEDKKVKAKPKIQFEKGETVKITDGPFMNFTGTIDEIDPERGRLKISVAIFGRTAPVELEYWQVERA
jgi:transcriptional antiterminator NusG